MTDLEQLEREYRDPASLMSRKLDTALRIIGGGPELLDVGCGTGEFLNRVAEKFVHAFGVDQDEEAVLLSRRRLSHYPNVEIFRARVGDLAGMFPPNSFDWITVMDVLEHLNQAQTRFGLANIARLMKLGGNLLLTVPNWYDFVKIGLRRAGDHTQAHSSLGWARIVSGAGLEVVDVGTIRFPLVDSALLRENLHVLGMCVYVHARRRR